jgi:putative membrane protein
MIRLLVRGLLALVANAVGLYIASLVLDGFNISGTGYVTAVIIFTLATVILGPLVTKIAFRNMPALMGGIALVTTLVGLIITDLISEDLSISGLDTWVLATLIVWLCSLLATVILPLFLFKQILSDDKKQKTPPPAVPGA